MLLLVAGAGAVVAVTQLSSSAGGPPATTTTSGPTSTTPPPTTQPLVPDGTYQVATTTLSVVDSSVSGSAPRTLPTTVWYPAVSAGADAAPDWAGGPYPLLVFSQGFGVRPDVYSPIIDAWASAGFVVAGPTYPHTDVTQPTLDEADMVNHPADLHAVIATVVATAGRPGSVLSGLVATKEIGLVGQSDGGDVSLAVGANTCCRYPGVDALAILSGAEDKLFGGQYFAGPTPPLLVVQGDADLINPPGCSVQIYDAAPQPKYYLDLLGASHLESYTTVDAYETVVAQVTTDFFETELSGRRTGAAAMAGAGNVAGTATLTAGPAAPAAPGTGGCPTAP